MAVHDSRSGSGGSPTLPDVVPFDLAHLTRQSWELGASITQDEQATALGTWTHRNELWRLSLFEVTTETVILRVRTPVGRERFYGAIRSELRSAIHELEADSSWQQVA